MAYAYMAWLWPLSIGSSSVDDAATVNVEVTAEAEDVAVESPVVEISVVRSVDPWLPNKETKKKTIHQTITDHITTVNSDSIYFNLQQDATNGLDQMIKWPAEVDVVEVVEAEVVETTSARRRETAASSKCPLVPQDPTWAAATNQNPGYFKNQQKNQAPQYCNLELQKPGTFFLGHLFFVHIFWNEAGLHQGMQSSLQYHGPVQGGAAANRHAGTDDGRGLATQRTGART